MSAVVEVREPSARDLSALQPKVVQHFELMATAPGGVARLRELILTLAVQGKLVPQDPSDEPASELLQKIRAEKHRLISAGKLKRDKPLASLGDEECPFDLPSAWTWARLGQVAKKITDGTHHSPANFPTGDFKYLSAKNIKSWGIDLSEVTYVPAAIHDEIYARCDPELGDILFIKDGATTGVLTINTLDEPFSLLSSVGVIKPSCGISSEWLALMMRSPFFYRGMRAGMTGVAITRVTLSKLGAAITPLPPLAEQARIVTRVEELMRLCDALEAKGQLEAAQHAQLVQTLLGALTASATPAELADNWQRVATHFDLLLDRPEAIDALEQTILQLAVRGLLVPQDPKDEPASVLLQKIRVEKDRLIAEGKIKRDKSLAPIAKEEQPAMLPQGWAVVRFGDYFFELCTGPFGSVIHKEDYVDGGVPLINPSHMVGGRILHDPSVSVSLLMAGQLGAYRLTAGDVVLARRGEVGRYALVTKVEDGWLCGTGSFFVKLHECCNRGFLGLIMEDPDLRMHLLGESVGSTMTNLNQRILIETPIALPPLAEQSRIVTRVESLRRLCADIRQRLAARQTTQAHLAEALIAEVG